MGNILVESKGVKRRHKDIDDDDSDTSAKRKKLKSTLNYMYNELFCKGEGSDISISAFGKLWNLHKICLQGVDYFKNMFNGVWSESEKRTISLQFSDDLITEEAFSKAMGTLYSDEIELSPAIAPHILATSSWFGMHELTNLTVTFLSESLSYDSVVQDYTLSEKYNCKELKKYCLDFLAYNLFATSPIQVLRETSVELMTEILANPLLFVIHFESDLYRWLKKWLYLKLFPEWQGELSDLSEAAHLYFSTGHSRKTDNGKSFLETEIGKIFVPAFLFLRLEHAICSERFCEILKSEDIIPRSWRASAYEKQWSRIMKVKECLVDGQVDDERFESSCVRCGRELKEGNRICCWKWMSFNFGCNMVFAWFKGTLCVKRDLNPSSSLLDSCPSHTLFYRINLFSLNDKGVKSCEFKTDIRKAKLDLYSDVMLLNVEENKIKYPLFLSFKFFHPSPLDWRTLSPSKPSLISSKTDFDSLPLTQTFTDDGTERTDFETEGSEFHLDQQTEDGETDVDHEEQALVG